MRDMERGEQRRAAEHEQRENPRREQLGGYVVSKRRERQFHEGVAADGKSAPQTVTEAAIVILPYAVRQTEIVFKREVFGCPDVFNGVNVVNPGVSVEISSVAAQRD